jgi:hypothetical protein
MKWSVCSVASCPESGLITCAVDASLIYAVVQVSYQLSYQLCMMLKGGGKPKTRNLSSYYTIISCLKHQKKVLKPLYYFSAELFGFKFQT